MTRSTMLLFVALLAATPAAQAAAARPAGSNPAVGNTVLIIDPDGRSRKIWLEPDGGWTGLGRGGTALAGRWTEEDGKVCLNQSQPPLFGSLCERLPAMGASLETTDPLGRPVRVKLVKGRVTG